MDILMQTCLKNEIVLFEQKFYYHMPSVTNLGYLNIRFYSIIEKNTVLFPY